MFVWWEFLLKWKKKFLQGTLFLLDPSPIIALSPLATIEGKGSRIAVTTFDLCYIRFIGAAYFCPNKGFCVSENAQQQCLWAHTSFALKRRSTTFVFFLFFWGGCKCHFWQQKTRYIFELLCRQSTQSSGPLCLCQFRILPGFVLPLSIMSPSMPPSGSSYATSVTLLSSPELGTTYNV